MRHDEISQELRDLAFDFFYWFSRFEFALKEAPYLEDDKVDARAMPGWGKFIVDWQDRYTLTPAGQKLIDAKPQRQIVGQNGLDFAEVRFDDKPSDLVKVIRLAKTVRNNLFHGGKHGSAYWDDPDRMRALIPITKAALDDIAQQTCLGADYSRYY
ncbi:hypothetical protein [Sphingomonas solaris]|uniref:Uncharacterized protein n=1 Tax=Alterirhizorhabdus solaris TaxID=2529389 RepID=A0A558R987_9SPHN|nr:hypothetical protein [Sphingomonas solaris]TVV75934.1 hypothetical protein FOY91_05660 [Sphingomonas solaris]